MIDYFERKIRLKDFEVWDVRIGDQLYTLAIVDECRPSSMNIFYLPEPIQDEGDSRENTVTATYYTEQLVNDEHREVLGEFARQLTDHLALAHCHVDIKFQQDRPAQAIENVMLMKYGYVESDIPLEKLWHFNQE